MSCPVTSDPGKSAAAQRARRRTAVSWSGERWLAPAELLRSSGIDTGDARLGVVGKQLGPGVVEPQTGGSRRMDVLGRQVVDRVHPVGCHLARELARGRGDRAVGDVRQVRAAAVDRDD